MRGFVLGAGRRAVQKLQAAPRRVCVTSSQTQVRLVSKQTLPRLDSGAYPATHPGRGEHAGGAVGILRGRSVTLNLGADDPQRVAPAGSGAAASETRHRGRPNCRRGPAAAGRTISRSTWPRLGSMVTWWTSLPPRLGVSKLARHTDMVGTLTCLSRVSVRPKQVWRDVYWGCRQQLRRRGPSHL